MTILTIADRRERRAAIAKMVADGATADEAAVAFRVSVYTVYIACREAGTPYPRRVGRPRCDGKTMPVLADLLNTDKSARYIAEKHGLAVGTVRTLLRDAVRAGIAFPQRVDAS